MLWWLLRLVKEEIIESVSLIVQPFTQWKCNIHKFYMKRDYGFYRLILDH
jgi:hypothetical protein